MNRDELERIGERAAAFQRRAQRTYRALTWALWLALAIAVVRFVTRWW